MKLLPSLLAAAPTPGAANRLHLAVVVVGLLAALAGAAWLVVRRARRAARGMEGELRNAPPMRSAHTFTRSSLPAYALAQSSTSRSPDAAEGAGSSLPPTSQRRPTIQVIRARSASDVLDQLDAQEDAGNLPDVRPLIEQIFRKPHGRKPNLPN